MIRDRLIYVVIGQSGEYSDRNEWLVRAFTDEEKAKTLIVKLIDDPTDFSILL